MMDQVDDEAIERYLERQKELKNKEKVGEMTFIEHLEALRWHLVRSIIAIMVIAIVAFCFPHIIFGKIILGPSKGDFITFQWLCQLADIFDSDALCIEEIPFTLQSRKMQGQFVMHLMSSFVIGLVCAFPYVFWEIWKFLNPALYNNEKNAAKGTTFIVSLLFFIGIFFGYYIVTPLSVNFLGNYSIDESIINEFDITSYVSTVTTLTLACGLMFQLAVAIYFLSIVGLVTPTGMRSKRKHALIGVLLLSAIITPPDIISQILIAVPLMGLYEIGIRVSGRVYKRMKKQENGN